MLARSRVIGPHIREVPVMKEDTPQDVIRAGRNASVGLKSMKFALQDTEAIAARMQNSEFAGHVLAFAKKKDLRSRRIAQERHIKKPSPSQISGGF